MATKTTSLHFFKIFTPEEADSLRADQFANLAVESPESVEEVLDKLGKGSMASLNAVFTVEVGDVLTSHDRDVVTSVMRSKRWKTQFNELEGCKLEIICAPFQSWE